MLYIRACSGNTAKRKIECADHGVAMLQYSERKTHAIYTHLAVNLDVREKKENLLAVFSLSLNTLAL